MDDRKRRRSDEAPYRNGGMKKMKQEMDSTGIGGKSKPCTKFFSTSGCSFGDNCHFLHYVPGGYNAVAQTMNLGPPIPSHPRSTGVFQPALPDSPAPAPTVRNRMCNKYNSAEGCRFGDNCHFAHGEWELGKPVAPSYDDPRHAPAGNFVGRSEPPKPGLAATFGTSASAKISVDSSLAGAIIGKGGVNSKQICRQTGVKLSIRDHELDANLRNIELEGSFEQIKEASGMVRELIANLGLKGSQGRGNVEHHYGGGGGHRPGSFFKTRLCEKFENGTCTFGDRCHYAHGASELRKPVT